MTTTFNPSLVIIRENALDYPTGQELYDKFQDKDIEVKIVSSKGPFPLNYDIPFQKQFHRAKSIIVVSVRSLSKFQTCKPSAHYQLPLVSGCPGHCHYCYLSTNLGKNPYVKIYVNIEEILEKAKSYIDEQKPETIIFEGAATSDPVPVEKWSKSLSKTIKFFAETNRGKFRFVTKYTEVDPFLNLNHKKQTEIRFSLNSNFIINKFEPTTPKPEERIKAAYRIFQADYPLGFLIAPIFYYQNWKNDYEVLIRKLKNKLNTNGKNIFFELISHRYTERAKEIIEKAYPKTDLIMEKEDRKFKYGQFGYGKYIYKDDIMEKIENYMNSILNKYFPEAEIKYFV